MAENTHATVARYASLFSGPDDFVIRGIPDSREKLMEIGMPVEKIDRLISRERVEQVRTEMEEKVWAAICDGDASRFFIAWERPHLMDALLANLPLLVSRKMYEPALIAAYSGEKRNLARFPLALLQALFE